MEDWDADCLAANGGPRKLLLEEGGERRIPSSRGREVSVPQLPRRKSGSCSNGGALAGRSIETRAVLSSGKPGTKAAAAWHKRFRTGVSALAPKTPPEGPLSSQVLRTASELERYEVKRVACEEEFRGFRTFSWRVEAFRVLCGSGFGAYWAPRKLNQESATRAER
ncbi:hypothetical protein KFL_001970040 [Klebsormidium nitens]|uniref:Uncharacterized protein n=1 Tax=Klebsormidium nitens TaxID=105231 RepID=A0A1Y1I0Y6_KLENI|nr:hypothetical protein KFL_001970040 [Klebsormidium nitens]|eukprot:GAQ84600.1 hypothetical protein KFL_001970040 [Klebsormidium nitens]